MHASVPISRSAAWQSPQFSTPGAASSAQCSLADALGHSRLLPRREDLAVTNVPDDEWAAFQEGLAET
jgi:hypothetical protein